MRHIAWRRWGGRVMSKRSRACFCIWRVMRARIRRGAIPLLMVGMFYHRNLLCCDRLGFSSERQYVQLPGNSSQAVTSHQPNFSRSPKRTNKILTMDLSVPNTLMQNASDRVVVLLSRPCGKNITSSRGERIPTRVCCMCCSPAI